MARLRFEPVRDLGALTAVRPAGRGQGPEASGARARALGGLVAALGALPGENRVASVSGREVLWLGPDEFLIASSLENGSDLEQVLRATGAGAVIDLSSNWVGFDLAGDGARAVLASGCSIDFHPRSFGVGSIAQTSMARVPITIWQRSPEPSYRILVRPSLASYLAAWVADAAGSLEAGSLE
ncbi:MAG: sarcosine oxidase subunit gamma [Gemmatimonadetes bacterium]|nr:sarcosine oxidase subunit gamma [Gemmatimonadota bacterium]